MVVPSNYPQKGYFSLEQVPVLEVPDGTDRPLFRGAYNFTLLERVAGARLSQTADERTTLVMTGGRAALEMNYNGHRVSGMLGPNDGVYIPQGAEFSLHVLQPMTALSVSSKPLELHKGYLAKLASMDELERNKQGFQWLPPQYLFSLDAGGPYQQVYHVDKPWGGEDWLTVLSDGHVLKRIWMHAGKRSSLQTHDFKSETNYVVSGQADVLLQGDGPEDEIRPIIAGAGWHVLPPQRHRVIANQPYTAFEASTPEVHDVNRLADDAGRQHGYIATEHKGV